jgi:salicylate hydroxylase
MPSTVLSTFSLPPAHAQGVSSSIEDAAALEILLADITSSQSPSSPPSETLLKRLQVFQTLRLPRVSATQILTDPVPPGPNAGPAQDKKVEQIRKYYQGPLPPKDAFPHSEAICQFFFGYDVRAEAEKALREAETKE